jgi:hypothetical protein
MRRSETVDCEPREALGDSGPAEAAKAAGKVMAARAALGLVRRRAQDVGERARDFGGRAREAGGRARDFAVRAPGRARNELVRRRTGAAARLESLAEVVRPDEVRLGRARRKGAAIVGGSTLALAAAVGAGVALGMYISRKLQERRASATAAQPSEAASSAGGATPTNDPTAFADVSGLPH